jgi:hypothetical protein
MGHGMTHIDVTDTTVDVREEYTTRGLHIYYRGKITSYYCRKYRVGQHSFTILIYTVFLWPQRGDETKCAAGPCHGSGGSISV